MTPADQQGWSGRKETVAIGGAEFAYVEITGSEPALLLIHGFTDTSRSFSLLAPHLAGRRLLIPDLPGHGDSPNSTGGVRPKDFAADVGCLIKALDLDRPIVVGHSMGGMIAIELAAGRPDLVGGLVLLATTLRVDVTDEDAVAIGVLALQDPISPADPFYDFWHACEVPVAPDFLARTAEEASAMPAGSWRSIFDEVRRADLTERVRKVRAKTLIVSGGRDPLFDRTHQERLRATIPTAGFVEAEQCGHNVHWENPALVAEAIIGHFGGH